MQVVQRFNGILTMNHCLPIRPTGDLLPEGCHDAVRGFVADVISGKPSRLQYAAVTVTATDSTRVSGSVKFTWLVDSEGAIRSGMSSGRCIADRSGKIKIECCNGASNQRWLLTPACNGTGSISLAKATGTCVTVNRSRTASGAKVVASR